MIVRRDLSKRLVLKTLQKHQKTTKKCCPPSVRNLTLGGKSFYANRKPTYYASRQPLCNSHKSHTWWDVSLKNRGRHLGLRERFLRPGIGLCAVSPCPAGGGGGGGAVTMLVPNPTTLTKATIGNQDIDLVGCSYTSSPGTHHLAPITWHPSPGTHHLASITWHPSP